LEPRRWIGPTLVFACLSAHLWAISRIDLPSQDGLKFIHIAQEFGRQPAWEVIRSADQHPLYPALIAIGHKFIEPFHLEPHRSWRLAAQGVSLAAALATLWPLYAITCRLYRPTTALIALFLWLVLPMPMSLGHETLSDSTALCCLAWSLWLALKMLDSARLLHKVGFCTLSALFVAAGYWTRPESFLAAPAIGLTWLVAKQERLRWRVASAGLFSAIICGFMLLYITVNGSLSDRLVALNQPGTRVIHQSDSPRLAKGLPPALRDPKLDFSPKDPVREQAQTGLRSGVSNLVRLWAESLGDALAIMTLWGLFRCRSHHQAARRLMSALACLLVLALAYQACFRGYLSSRHVLGLTFLSIPHAAAALRLCALRFAGLVQLPPAQRRRGTRLAIGIIAVGGIWLQAKPIHASRKGHQRAGQWLRGHARPGSAVFDSRGFASFQADLRRYDPLHMPQALSDSSTGFWVLEAGELTSGSRRAATLKKILADGGQLVARFPRKKDREDAADVLVFSWARPDWWDQTPAIQAIAQGKPQARLDQAVKQALSTQVVAPQGQGGHQP